MQSDKDVIRSQQSSHNKRHSVLRVKDGAGSYDMPTPAKSDAQEAQLVREAGACQVQ